MKILDKISLLALILLIVASCQKGIDPISKVDPGPDTAVPVVKINYPNNVTVIRDEAAKVPIKIQLEASDDIELASIVVKMDGTQIASFSSFLDYRRAVEEYVYDGVTDGIHELIVTATDLSGKATSVTVSFLKTTPYHPLYDGEVFYMPFEGDAIEQVSNKSATVVGFPAYVDGKKGKAYSGAVDSYLTFPSAGLLGTEFSVVFWYNLNNAPLRGGIFEIARPYTLIPPSLTPNDSTRRKGFRMARENVGTTGKQNLFINMGIGEDEVWINPIVTAFAPTNTWKHIAVSVSTTTVLVYVDNVLAKTVAIKAPIDWTDCNPISIMSGMPNFTYWDHKSDLSQMDELRIFNKAITAEQVNQLYTSGK